jgi:hypothetical protein
MNLEDLEIEYKYSSRRKSIGLMVTAEGKLVISAPRGTAAAQIARAVARHRDWIEQKVAERKEAWARLREGGAFFLGRPYRLTMAQNGAAPVVLTGEEIRVRPRLGNSVWPPLRAWLIRQAETLLNERVARYAPEFGVKVRPVELREWKRRWGECHPDLGRLRFNWRLIMLPPEIIDYVVVHELAHLVAPGHNPRFWQAVLPDHQERRQWLNLYGTPFLLWEPGAVSA